MSNQNMYWTLFRKNTFTNHFQIEYIGPFISIWRLIMSNEATAVINVFKRNEASSFWNTKCILVNIQTNVEQTIILVSKGMCLDAPDIFLWDLCPAVWRADSHYLAFYQPQLLHHHIKWSLQDLTLEDSLGVILWYHACLRDHFHIV